MRDGGYRSSCGCRRSSGSWSGSIRLGIGIGIGRGSSMGGRRSLLRRRGDGRIRPSPNGRQTIRIIPTGSGRNLDTGNNVLYVMLN